MYSFACRLLKLQTRTLPNFKDSQAKLRTNAHFVWDFLKCCTVVRKWNSCQEKSRNATKMAKFN